MCCVWDLFIISKWVFRNMVFISPKLQLQDGIVIGKLEEMVSEIGLKVYTGVSGHRLKLNLDLTRLTIVDTLFNDQLA